MALHPPKIWDQVVDDNYSILSKCVILIMYVEKNLVLMITIKNIIKSEIIVILLGNKEGLLIVFAT